MASLLKLIRCGSKGNSSAPSESVALKPNPQLKSNRFDELSSGNGFRIPLTEERGIKLRQLSNLVSFMQRHCDDENWLGRDGGKLTWDRVSLYDLVEHVVKPATQKPQCSYVELVAAGPQLPKWFVSHWWGQMVADFVKCILQHSTDRDLGEDITYWICAYAAVQWTVDSEWIAPDWVNMYASNQWYDPTASPFQKAMRLAEGTLSIIDSEAQYFKRIWCCYEIWSAMQLNREAVTGQGNHSMFDMYTVSGDRSVGITDGLAKVDMKRAQHWWTANKYTREKHFPIALSRSALGVQLEMAVASQDSDRKHILNTIAHAADLDEEPAKSHESYEELNNTVRGRFAASVWRRALENDEHMRDFARVLAVSGLPKLALSFDSCAALDDMGARVLAAGLPASLQDLDLDFSSCSQLSDDGIEALVDALPSALRQLKLDLSGCKQVTDAGVKALARALLAQNSQAMGGTRSTIMEDLMLNLNGNGQLSENALVAVAQSLPSTVKTLVLNFYGCVALGDDVLNTVAAKLPPSLSDFEIRVARCPSVTDSGVQALAAKLPSGLRRFVLDVRFCIGITDESGVSLASQLPPHISHLELDFISCSQITAKTEEVLRQAVAKRPNVDFTFWGKDDFAVNM